MQDRSHMRSPHGNRLGDRQDAARRLTRRAALLGAAAGIGALAANGGRPALAALTLDLNRGNIQPLPIALPDFLAGSPPDGEAARGISQIITANLKNHLTNGTSEALDSEPVDVDKESGGQFRPPLIR